VTEHRRRMGVADHLVEIADALEAGATDHAFALAREHVAPAPTVTIPFRFTATERARVAAASKGPSLKPAQKLRIYERDGFVDRYSPERWRLVNPGALRVLSLRLGPLMATELSTHNIPAKYATNSPVWFDVWPAVDHVDARAYGGSNDATNLITCSWWRNAAKGSRELDETGWEVQEAGSLEEWDGLTAWFQDQVTRDPRPARRPDGPELAPTEPPGTNPTAATAYSG
jgi:hypothetical protein